MSSREILTLQFGNYANYVGTHWWNLQEFGFNYDSNDRTSEIDHDILYREGQNDKGGVTYTPRLLLCDLKGSLKHHPKDGELNGECSTSVKEVDSVLWDPDCYEILETEKIEKPEFLKDLDNVEDEEMVIDKDYDFTNNVQTWTDFMYARYHPRTVHLVQEYEQSKNQNSFDTFSNGSSIWKSENFEDDFGDKIRQYLEECNNCQGFQTLFDCTNGFSGLTLKCLQHLNDEYSKVNFAVPIIPPSVENFANSDGPMSDSIRLINIALTYSNLIENSSLFLPLSTMSKGWRSISNQRNFPLINYENSNVYQTSSILATYLDTISLQYRLKNPGSSNNISSFCEINNYGRKMAAAGLALPFKMSPMEDLIDCLDKTDGSLFTQLSPNSEIGTNRICQNVCIRGIPKTRLKRPQKSAKAQMKMAAYRCDSVSEMFQLYFQCKNYQSLSNVSSIESGMAIRTPYPTEMFHEQINFEGFLSEFEIQEKQKIVSTPVLATIQVSNDLANTLESLHREASRVKIARIHRFKESGLEADELVECLDKLLEFKDNYEEGFEL